MQIFESREQVLDFLKTISKPEKILTLAISDSLQDPMGLNIAVILDAILALGLKPDGFEQKDNYWVYKYVIRE